MQIRAMEDTYGTAGYCLNPAAGSCSRTGNFPQARTWREYWVSKGSKQYDIVIGLRRPNLIRSASEVSVFLHMKQIGDVWATGNRKARKMKSGLIHMKRTDAMKHYFSTRSTVEL